MSRTGMSFCAALLLLVLPSPVHAQAGGQFRADMRMSGGSLDEPADGTMYYGGSKVRMEMNLDGESMILLADPSEGTNYLLMPDEKMYMELGFGMVSVTPPLARGMNPSNPCSSPDLTDCERLGTENVNGHATTKWSYMTTDGEAWTSWVANDISFPVRMVDEDGTTTDLTNVQLGAQPASLFTIPRDYQKMDLGFAGAFGGGRGRGGPGRGRGGPGTPGAPGAPGAAGFPPGFDPAAFGVDPATLQRQMQQIGTDNPGSAAWEAVEAWMLDVKLTETARTTERTDYGTLNDDYTAVYTASIPLNYAAPGLGTMQGPGWRVIPTIGSEKALARPMTLAVQVTDRHDDDITNDCSEFRGPPYRRLATTTGTYEGRESIRGMSGELMSQAAFSLAGDLKTYTLSVDIKGESGHETTTGQTRYGACPDSPARSEPIDESADHDYSFAIEELTGLPLPSAPGVIHGSQRVTLRGQRVQGSQATLEWTLTPIT